MDGIDPETGRWDWSLGRVIAVDVESTGVWRAEDPPALLEIAAVVADQDLTEIGRYSTVIKTEPEVLSDANPFVVTMHLESGLWKELKAGAGVSIREAELQLCRLLDNTNWGDPRPIVWVGSSPAALDRPLVQSTMPNFYGMIHHRSIDVSSVRLVMQNFAGVRMDRGAPRHRALSDAVSVLEHLRCYKSKLANPAPTCA